MAPKSGPFIIFGIFPNNTIVRKYANGTIVRDDDDDVEVTNLTARELKYSLINNQPIPTTSTTTTTPASDSGNNLVPPDVNIQDNLIDTVLVCFLFFWMHFLVRFWLKKRSKASVIAV